MNTSVSASSGLISTHTPLARRDSFGLGKWNIIFIFLLTRPLRGVTNGVVGFMQTVQISTHTPLARRDVHSKVLLIFLEISTHTPLARRDEAGYDVPVKESLFLLTRPLRGVTMYQLTQAMAAGISTHTPLARRDSMLGLIDNSVQISTHTPLARRDLVFLPLLVHLQYFYSHAPCEA